MLSTNGLLFALSVADVVATVTVLMPLTAGEENCNGSDRRDIVYWTENRHK